jgi:trk system potassium uptake protein
MRLRPVLLVIGVMSLALGLMMLLPALIDYVDAVDEWRAFVLCAVITCLFGLALTILNSGGATQLGVREAFILTTFSWIVLTGLAAMPLVLHGLSFTDAYFEAMSGLTTTGATVITGLDDMTRGILLWRALLQWFGGIGIIVTAIAILPMLRVGGMQLFAMENSDQSGKFLPRVSDIAVWIGGVYLGLSALCAILYSANGMSAFNAIVHSMTTLSAGGFSTTDQSFGEFSAGNNDLVAIFFMLCAALPFGLFVQAVRGQYKGVLSDPQPRLLLALATIGTLLVGLGAYSGPSGWTFDDQTQAFRVAAFNVVSVMTGTGYASDDYSLWGPSVDVVLLGLMFCGGCAGSAACGIKMFRIQIAVSALVTYALRMARPHRVVPVRYAGKPVSDDDLQSVMLFIYVFMSLFSLFAIVLAMMGLDTITAISASIACLGNVGPGLGPIVGPTGSYAALPDAAIWVCSLAMLLGRLEIFAALVLLTPRFWRN